MNEQRERDRNTELETVLKVTISIISYSPPYILGIDIFSALGIDIFSALGIDCPSPATSSKDTTAISNDANFILSVYSVRMRRCIEVLRLGNVVMDYEESITGRF